MPSPRIMLLHATTVAMEPIHSAFRKNWEDAEIVNLLEDGLTIDRAKTHELAPSLIERFVKLCALSQDMEADGLLITCSAFGPAIEKAASILPIPVLKPNEAMFEAAIASGENIAMVATFQPSVVTMEEEFKEQTKLMNSKAKLTTFVIPDAMAALRKGDADTHNRLIAERASDLAGFDAVMLAHFSTSRAAPLLRESVSIPIHTAPDAAVIKMRKLVAESQKAK